MKVKSLVCTFLLMAALQVQASVEKIQLQGAVGKLSVLVQKPELRDGEKCPVVLLMHGFSGNKQEKRGMLKEIADKLEQNGVASIRFDFNGHGESEGLFQNMTVLNEIEDAKKVIEYAQAQSYTQSISVLGHSQGGVVASMVAGQLGTSVVKSAVLMAPAAVLREDALRGSTMGKQYNPADPPEFVELFGSLKLGREYILTAQSLPIYETATQYIGPVCVIHGTGDVVVPYTFGVCYNREYRNSELHLLPGENHGFTTDMQKAVNLAVGFLLAQVK